LHDQEEGFDVWHIEKRGVARRSLEDLRYTFMAWYDWPSGMFSV